MEGSWRWFRNVVGLLAKGLFPKPNMKKRYATKEECETLWGKRKSNNGFRYTNHDAESLKTRIETLICQVCQHKHTTDSDIYLSFALGVFAERKGFSIIGQNLLRVCIGGREVFRHYLNTKMPILARMGRKRRKVAKAMGWTLKVMAMGCTKAMPPEMGD